MSIDFFYSLITALFVGAAAGCLGSLMITKRMALTGDALGHVALPGMGLAIVFGLNVAFGAFVFLLAGVLLIWFLERKTELPAETLFGIVFVFSLALGFLVVPEPEMLHALAGDISHVSFLSAFLAVVFSVIAVFSLWKIYSKMILISISEDLAAANNINIKKYNLIYLLLIAAVVAIGVKIVGSLLVGALVIIPAAASRNISGNLKQYVFWSAIFGIFSCVFGVVVSKISGFPIGPIVILIGSFLFLVSLIFKK